MLVMFQCYINMVLFPWLFTANPRNILSKIWNVPLAVPITSDVFVFFHITKTVQTNSSFYRNGRHCQNSWINAKSASTTKVLETKQNNNALSRGT